MSAVIAAFVVGVLVETIVATIQVGRWERKHPRLTDADRAVLDAADRLFDKSGHMRAAHYGSTVMGPLRAAVRARREAQS